jgi:phosphoglucosamine mutase
MESVECALEDCYNDVDHVNNIDGIRITFTDGSWVLIRPSGTEPYIRITLEGKTEERAKEILKISKNFLIKSMN